MIASVSDGAGNPILGATVNGLPSPAELDDGTTSFVAEAEGFGTLTVSIDGPTTAIELSFDLVHGSHGGGGPLED